jgi:hypothetical protein
LAIQRAVEDILLIHAATDSIEWLNRMAFLPL